jgi:hypothetical protein
MRTSLAIIVAAALSTSACATAIMSGADFAPGVDFSNYTSFTWDEPDDGPVGDPRLENNPFFENRLHSAIERELFERGIERREVGAGLVIHHHATVRDRVDVYEADRAAGYETPEYGAGTQVVQYDEGTFLIDIIDANTQEVLWRGWAQLDLTRALANALVMEDQINAAVDRMFDDLPETVR